jgi:hypothetical protein
VPHIWLPCVYIIPALQSTAKFALHFNAPGISSCHSWTPNVFTLTAGKEKERDRERERVSYKYSVDAPVTVQTKSKMAS